ncbi:uncharacterized protein DS421_18g615650 [Arachis hypogaea]|nr:uncharacterized protein DS421_18g615650 [Arachis hypogaea]
MAISASRSDINRRFMATMNSWPSDDDRLIKFRLVKVKGKRHFPKHFLARYGKEFGNTCFAIDHCDNCLKIQLVGNHMNRVIEEDTFETIRAFYQAERDVTVKLWYVGFGLFYLSLWDKMNFELALTQNPNFYVRDQLTSDKLDEIELNLNLKYVQKDEQPQVTSSSGDSPQSTDVEEVVGPNTADPVEIDNHMRDIIFHTYSKELQPSDIGASRLYVPVDFAEILKTFGDAAIWTIISPPSPQGLLFCSKAIKILLILLISGLDSDGRIFARHMC